MIALAALGARSAAQRGGARAGGRRRGAAQRRAADGPAARVRVRARQRGAVRALHRARPPRLAPPGDERLDGLAAAMLVALVLVTPVGGWQVLGALGDPVALLAGVGVGISLVGDPVRDRSARDGPPERATYSLMVALLPATAVVVGVVVLGQLPSAAELVAVGLVIAGVAVHRDAPKPASSRAEVRVEASARAAGSGLRRAGRADSGSAAGSGSAAARVPAPEPGRAPLRRARRPRRCTPSASASTAQLGAFALLAEQSIDRQRARGRSRPARAPPRSAPRCTRSRRS